MGISIRDTEVGELARQLARLRKTNMTEAIAHALDLEDKKLLSSGTFFDHETLGENVVYSDVLAMMRLESVVGHRNRPIRVRLNLGTNLNELREGPTVFLGGLDNQWTLKLIEPLRYQFGGHEEQKS